MLPRRILIIFIKQFKSNIKNTKKLGTPVNKKKIDK